MWNFCERLKVRYVCEVVDFSFVSLFIISRYGSMRKLGETQIESHMSGCVFSGNWERLKLNHTRQVMISAAVDRFFWRRKLQQLCYIAQNSFILVHC
jgi:hypothetical protein